MTTSGLLNIKRAAKLLDVSIETLRIWDRSGKLIAIRTPGGQRRYRVEDLERFQGIHRTEVPRSEATAVYCRVSSHEQKAKGDLDRQKGRVLQHCIDSGYKVAHIFDEVGSGMNDTRAKLMRLLDLALKREICRVVVEHRDRLTRFSFNIYRRFFEAHGVTIEWMEDVLPKSYEQELTEDLLSLMSSFTSKVYGRRSAENRRKKKAKAT